jgi:rhamnogalacturonyl hydrolase YesR
MQRHSSSAHEQTAPRIGTRPWLPEESLAPAYPFAYAPGTRAGVIAVLDRVRRLIDESTPAQVIDRRTGAPLSDPEAPAQDPELRAGAFRLVCYEWGVTYGAMLEAADATGDSRFSDYAASRLQFIADWEPRFRSVHAALPAAERRTLAFRGIVAPRNLDDAGSMAASMLKARRRGLVTGLDPIIERFLDYVRHRQFRLDDGTLARNRPLPRSLWLDDLYMSVPALAHYGHDGGDPACFDEAVHQVRGFATRMFDRETKLYCHGWIEGMEPHPAFRWGRCNGWAMLAKAELLDVLPESHPARGEVLDLFRSHAGGVASRQHGSGRWHQLLDRNDTYLETSCSAIFTYCLARGINRGWLDGLAYGPVVQTGWSAVAEQVDAAGWVGGTCVGSGMALDPVFYTHRPVSPYAAHGYGPTLLAGAEMIRLLAGGRMTMHDSALHFGETAEEA